MLAGDRDDVDEAEAAHRVDVVRPDEPGADQAHPDAPHQAARHPRERLLA